MQRTPSALQHELHARRSHATASRAHEVAEVEKSSLRVNPARLVAAEGRSAGQLRASVLSSPTSLATTRERSDWTGRGCGSPREADALDAATFCYDARLPRAIRWIRVKLFFGGLAPQVAPRGLRGTR